MTITLGRRFPARFPGEHGDPEHGERERRERHARLEGVVAPDELQEDRQRDQHPSQRDLLQEELEDADAEQLGREERRIEQSGLAFALAAAEPVHQARHRRHADREQCGDGLAALLPDEDADDEAAHADDREERADVVDRAVARVRHVADLPAPQQDDDDDQGLERESRAPRDGGREEAADERPDRGGDGARRPDQRVDLRPLLPLEVAVDQRLHRRQVERGAEPAEDRPEDDDRGQPLRDHHRERPDDVEEQADHVGALAAEEVAELAADQDERGGHERLDRHGRLDAADRRVEVFDDRRDGHVHERRVDHEHEHRGREQQPETRRAAWLVGRFHAASFDRPLRLPAAKIAATRIPETVMLTAGSCKMSVLTSRWWAEVSRYWASIGRKQPGRPASEGRKPQVSGGFADGRT